MKKMHRDKGECVTNGITFKKSSLSKSGVKIFCVGVGIKHDVVYVTNTKNTDVIIQFTMEEWDAFIGGVKLGEFDCPCEI